MDSNTLLSQLRDIHSPAPIPFWPLAPGWWLLLGLFIIALSVGIYLLVRFWRANEWKRQAKKQFDQKRKAYENSPSIEGIIDINKVLTESKAAIDATKQIDKIQKNSEEESKSEDDLIIKERERLIEQQSVMAPEAFEVKVNEFDKKVQEYQLARQEEIRKLDKMVQSARSKILDQIKPIITDYSNELGITVMLEKNSVILSADEMDMTNVVIERLNKELPKVKIEFDN